MTNLMKLENTMTMTSREIAELTGKRHDNVLADIKKMLEELELNSPAFSGQYKDSTGRSLTMYSLDKELTTTLVAGYNVKMRHAIIKRWQELEAKEQKIKLSYLTSLIQQKQLWLGPCSTKRNRLLYSS